MFGERVPLVSELLDTVRCATIVDGAAVLHAADALVALTIGGGNTEAAQLRDQGLLQDTISGTALFQSLGVVQDHRYPASFACVAVAAALRSCLGPDFNGDAVLFPLVVLSLSGQFGAIMPTVARTACFEGVHDAAVELAPSESISNVQIETIATGFNLATPARRAADALEARYAFAAHATGRATLALVFDGSSFADAEELDRDLKLGEGGTVFGMLLQAAQSKDATATKLLVDPEGVPILDPLVDEVQRALGGMGETRRTLCVQKAKALLLRACSQTFLGIISCICALGITAACSAMLLVADGADRGLVVATLASLFGVQRIPSAFESKEVQQAEAWLKLCGMFPRSRSLRRPRMLIGALLNDESRDDLNDMFSEMVEEELAQAVRDADISASADAEDIRAAIGDTSSSDEGPHEGDTYGANPWWRKKLEEAMRVAARRMMAGPKVLSPECADLDRYKRIRGMALPSFTPSSPSPLEWLHDVEGAFKRAGEEDLTERAAESGASVAPKRKTGTKLKSAAKTKQEIAREDDKEAAAKQGKAAASPPPASKADKRPKKEQRDPNNAFSELMPSSDDGDSTDDDIS